MSKYIVDPDIDTTFEGGYYLQFHTTNEGVYAYWSINPDSTWEQISRNFGKTQTQFLGSSFDSEQFTKLLKYLINTSGKHGKQGYVQVVITRKNLQSPYFFTKFFNDMISYLARNYPRDEPTADPYVGWEVEK